MKYCKAIHRITYSDTKTGLVKKNVLDIAILHFTVENVRYNSLRKQK